MNTILEQLGSLSKRIEEQEVDLVEQIDMLRLLWQKKLNDQFTFKKDDIIKPWTRKVFVEQVSVEPNIEFSICFDGYERTGTLLTMRNFEGTKDIFYCHIAQSKELRILAYRTSNGVRRYFLRYVPPQFYTYRDGEDPAKVGALKAILINGPQWPSKIIHTIEIIRWGKNRNPQYTAPRSILCKIID